MNGWIHFEPARRVAALPENYFAHLEGRIMALESAGREVIRLDIGSPDLAPKDWVIDALERSARDHHNHGYQSLKGPEDLRNAWAAFYSGRFGVDLDPADEVLPLMGSKEGIFNFIATWAETGGVVIVPDPGYMTYRRAALYAGAGLFYLPLDPDREYLPALEAIPETILARTRMLWLNYPNNPTAAVANLEFFEKVVALARRWRFWVCHDAAYTQITYDGYRAPSILEIPGAKDVAVEFNTLSKSHQMAGWRLGVLAGCAQAIRPLLRLESNMHSGQFKPVMDAAVAALMGDQSWMEARNEIYRSRRDAAIGGLAAAGFRVEKPKGSLYIWFPTPAGWQSRDFVLDVLETSGVSLTPGMVFGRGGEGYVRLSLTAAEDRIVEAMRRLNLWRK